VKHWENYPAKTERHLNKHKIQRGLRGMMIVISPAPGSVYKNLFDTLDEVMINEVRKYAIVELKCISWKQDHGNSSIIK
jgi:hypothetical protein